MKRWSAALLCVLALGCDRKDAEPWVETETDAGEFAVISFEPADGTQLPGSLAQVHMVFNRELSILSIRQNDNLRLTYPDPAASGPEADAGVLPEDDAGVDAGVAELVLPCNFALQKVDQGHDVTAIPMVALPPNTTFTFTVETTVASESGETLAAPFHSSFTTGSY